LHHLTQPTVTTPAAAVAALSALDPTVRAAMLLQQSLMAAGGHSMLVAQQMGMGLLRHPATTSIEELAVRERVAATAGAQRPTACPTAPPPQVEQLPGPSTYRMLVQVCAEARKCFWWIM